MTLSFWQILLAVLSYGLLHSLLASRKVKELARHYLGSKTDRWYRLAFNLVAFFTLLPILALPILLIDKGIYRIPFPWVILTLAIQLAALVVLIIAIKQTGAASFIGLQQLLLPEGTAPPKLVTSGLYKFVRRPQYTAGLVFIWLLPIMTWNLLALNIGLTIYILIGGYFEERRMLLEFGDEYAEYRHRTSMLIPGLRWKLK